MIRNENKESGLLKYSIFNCWNERTSKLLLFPLKLEETLVFNPESPLMLVPNLARLPEASNDRCLLKASIQTRFSCITLQKRIISFVIVTLSPFDIANKTIPQDSDCLLSSVFRFERLKVHSICSLFKLR